MSDELGITQAEVEQILVETPFIQYYDFRFHAFDEGSCTVKVPFREDFIRPGGIVSGPTLMAAADVAMWFAIMTKLGRTDMAVTVEMSTAFLSGAKQEDFLCRADVLKIGRRLIYGTAECVNETGKRLTHHTLTYIRPDA